MSITEEEEEFAGGQLSTRLFRARPTVRIAKFKLESDKIILRCLLLFFIVIYLSMHDASRQKARNIVPQRFLHSLI
jgi:hypothetical protein